MCPNIIILALSILATGGNPALRVDGKTLSLEPQPIISADGVFVPLHPFAHAIERQAKVILPNKLIILCDATSCAPVHLQKNDVRTRDNETYVNLEPLARALDMHLQRTADAIILTTRPAPPTAERGRIPPGSLLPDVLLTDLEGRPVHLSDFIGRRVLLCTWASW